MTTPAMNDPASGAPASGAPAPSVFGTVLERLDGNLYEPDPEESHISIDQAAARRLGLGQVLARVCPAHVYSVKDDGSVGILHAACLECGTCREVAPPGVLTWHYPRSGMGIVYREG